MAGKYHNYEGRTYKTRSGAVTNVETGLTKIGNPDCKYVLAQNEDGRYYAVVFSFGRDNLQSAINLANVCNGGVMVTG